MRKKRLLLSIGTVAGTAALVACGSTEFHGSIYSPPPDGGEDGATDAGNTGDAHLIVGVMVHPDASAD